MLSLVIPVYRNEANLPRLLAELARLNERMPEELELVFVVDGSPDRCFELLRKHLPEAPYASRLLLLSRNFGSFAAISAGLRAGRGDFFAVLAADLQEPPELVLEFLQALKSGEADIAFGVRERRSDPWLSEAASNAFWSLYRRFVIHDMPPGGVDVFGCTREVRDRVIGFPEPVTNLIALLFWLGFRRRYIGYERRVRLEGKSAWTIKKKLRYSFDSVFNFTALPIQLLLFAGVAGMSMASFFGAVALVARLTGRISVPGYTPILLAVMFVGGLVSLGFGIIGQYLWLSLENARRRPSYVVASEEAFAERAMPGTGAQTARASGATAAGSDGDARAQPLRVTP